MTDVLAEISRRYVEIVDIHDRLRQEDVSIETQRMICVALTEPLFAYIVDHVSFGDGDRALAQEFLTNPGIHEDALEDPVTFFEESPPWLAALGVMKGLRRLHALPLDTDAPQFTRLVDATLGLTLPSFKPA